MPVFKSGDKHNYNNYRPISLLSSFSKLMEKVVARQIIGFLKFHNLLYKHQYGFRENHSCSQPVLHFTDKFIMHSTRNHLQPEDEDDKENPEEENDIKDEVKAMRSNAGLNFIEENKTLNTADRDTGTETTKCP